METLSTHRPLSEIETYLTKWDKKADYVAQERALQALFHRRDADYLSESDLLVKCATLNDFYGTNIFKVYHVVQHYLRIGHLAERLEAGDLTLVEELRRVPVPIQGGGTKYIDRYSFATKFCSHHNSDRFPIYDSYVAHVLKAFRKSDPQFVFATAALRDYEQFVAVILQFKELYGLTKYGVKDIDRYLWQLGKEMLAK